MTVTLVTADWVLPIDGPKIPGGGVVVAGGTIEAVGAAEELRARFPNATLHEHPGCVLTPGLINAHTHLSLTALLGLMSEQEFVAWLPGIGRAVQALDSEDYAAAVEAGAVESLLAGVTAVGDVVYGREAIGAATALGLGGVFYWEVLGVPADEVGPLLSERSFHVRPTGARVRTGVSAHTTYTAGPDTIAEAHAIASQFGASFMMHAAESTAELDLLLHGEGPLAATAARLAVGFEPPRTGAIHYLEQLGTLDATVLVHCVHPLYYEFDLLPRAAGIVLCPRSNAYLENGVPPVDEILATGVAVALGTDSSASNADLDLRAEARALREHAPGLEPGGLLRMMTADAALVLGLQESLGALHPGMQSDIAVFATGYTDAPEEAVLSPSTTVAAVMSEGEWRVRDGALVSPPTTLDERIRKAARKARAAIESKQ